MDLRITGKFISQMRKEQGLTQLKLAEELLVSEKTISKWECGNGFPDTTLILPLCKVLGITANELLSGKRLQENEYKKQAEQNLVELKAEAQRSTKLLLNAEVVIGFMVTIMFMILVFTVSYFVQNIPLRIVLICVGAVYFLVGIIFCLRIEKDAGYYQCASCGHKYIPTYKAILWTGHFGRTRYLKCPHCNKRTWSKKVIEKD